MNKKIITDLWYEFWSEKEYLNIMINDGNQDKILAQISMTDDEFNRNSQEDLYNLCLEVADDLGYILAEDAK